MSVSRGDEYARIKKQEDSTKDAGETNPSADVRHDLINPSIGNISATGDHEPLIDRQTSAIEQNGISSNGDELIDDSEIYTGFKRITTIPAAALSIMAGFIMIASVCKNTV